MLRLRDDVRGPKPAKITIDPKTGFPLVDGKSVLEPRGGGDDTIMEEEDEEEEEEFGEFCPATTLGSSRRH